MDNIRTGKYIDLGSLLPRAALETRESFQMLVDADETSGQPRLNVLPKNVRSPLRSFHEWLTAFLTYAQAYLRFFPNKAGGIFAYIAQISRYAARYPLPAVLLYDQHFRRKLALFHPTSFWGVVDTELVDEPLGTRAPASATPAATHARADTTCHRCGLLGHFASACPASAPSAPAVAAVTTSTAQVRPSHATPVPPPFLAPQRLPDAVRPFATPHTSSFSFHQPRASSPDTFICRAFARGSCVRPDCHYAHVCATCRSHDHGAAHCPHAR